MKFWSVLFLAAVLSMPLAAQEQETLFMSDVEHGGFGGLVHKLTSIRGEAGLLMGGYGGWLINHRFMIGAGGYGLVTNVRASAESEAAYSPFNEALYIEFGYGGLMLEYVIAPSKLVHVNLQALVGAGGVTHRNNMYDNLLDEDGPDVRRYGRREAVFVTEPAVNVELNVTNWLRIAAGGSYRFVSGVNEIEGLTNKDLSGPSGNLALKFGAF
jgi:hypothetical protein